MYGTPVLGADTGGIPELIQVGKTGMLFVSGNRDDLQEKIEELWNDTVRLKEYRRNCKATNFDDIDVYYKKLMEIYEGKNWNMYTNMGSNI